MIDHAREGGVHWFEHFDDGGESTGHALAREYPDHAELDRVWVNPHCRGRGTGGRLVDAVTSHFDQRGKPVRLKPMPYLQSPAEPEGPDENDLRAWYRRHRFEDYQRREDDAWDADEHMIHNARREGVPPGGGRSHLSETERAVEWVRAVVLMAHREWHHGQGWSTEPDGTQYAPRHTPAEWEAGARSVSEEGIRQPVHVSWDPVSNAAYITEGNSRLVWAHNAGHRAVPVTGHRVSYGPEGAQYQLPGTSRAARVRERQAGHIPADLRPSEFLPPWYIHAGHQATGCRGRPVVIAVFIRAGESSPAVLPRPQLKRSPGCTNRAAGLARWADGRPLPHPRRLDCRSRPARRRRPAAHPPPRVLRRRRLQRRRPGELDTVCRAGAAPGRHVKARGLARLVAQLR